MVMRWRVFPGCFSDHDAADAPSLSMRHQRSPAQRAQRLSRGMSS